MHIHLIFTDTFIFVGFFFVIELTQEAHTYKAEEVIPYKQIYVWK